MHLEIEPSSEEMEIAHRFERSDWHETRAWAHFNTERASVQNGAKSGKKLGRSEVAKLPILQQKQTNQASGRRC